MAFLFPMLLLSGWFSVGDSAVRWTIWQTLLGVKVLLTGHLALVGQLSGDTSGFCKTKSISHMRDNPGVRWRCKPQFTRNRFTRVHKLLLITFPRKVGGNGSDVCIFDILYWYFISVPHIKHMISVYHMLEAACVNRQMVVNLLCHLFVYLVEVVCKTCLIYDTCNSNSWFYFTSVLSWMDDTIHLMYISPLLIFPTVTPLRFSLPTSGFADFKSPSVSATFASRRQPDGLVTANQPKSGRWPALKYRKERRDDGLMRIYESFVRYFCDTAVE